MGCCFSRATTQNQNPDTQNALKNQQPHLRSSLPKSNPTHEEAPPPPPPVLEEESVKEVLSETPISKPHQVPLLMAETKTQMSLVQSPAEKFETKDTTEEVSEVVSQLSEPCSMSESFSTATTATTITATTITATITEKREDEATSKQSSKEGTTTHKWNRSPSRKRPHAADGSVSGGRERRVKSPARRPEPSPSPEKKVKGSRFVRGRESGALANRKHNAGSAGLRRDSGEGSGRRSRSPSCARKAGGTSKVGVGGGRIQVPPAANGAEKEKKSESEAVEEKNDVVPQEESLENPHVSMECFIFL